MNENKWKDNPVTQALGAEVHHTNNAKLFLEDIAELGLRDNPKRPQILISNILGKHVPQDPDIIRLAGYTLGYRVLENSLSEGEKNTLIASTEYTSDDLFVLLKQSLEADKAIINVDDLHPVSTLADTSYVVLGYAETATSLGGLVSYILNSPYIHSTRKSYDTVFGDFQESHSHATEHHLSPDNLFTPFLLDSQRTVVLVDDEFTTGNTLMATISMLESQMHHDHYVIASFVDSRNEEARQTMQSFASKNNITITSVALTNDTLAFTSADEKSITGLKETIRQSNSLIDASKSTEYSRDTDKHRFTSILYSSQAPLARGVQSVDSVQHNIEHLAHKLYPMFRAYKNILVLGNEEDMFYELMCASALKKQLSEDTRVRFSATTRSPIIVDKDDNETYPILNKITYHTSAGIRYIYNIDKTFDAILLISEERVTSQEADSLGAKLGLAANTVIVCEPAYDINKLHSPLVGPEFSSYSPKDVAWLLKDVSNVKIERPTEDREEAIQSGEAHYAESLPIEFTPSEAYQKLFEDSLNTHSQALAEQVALLGEEIWNYKQGAPVLVSLARAGVPVGILLKRYLTASHHMDIPHYAISIVRGKGIDYNALKYICSHHAPSKVVFVDGWTGKGAITKELEEALREFEQDTMIELDSTLAVLADTGYCTSLYGTRDDYLIPSACLNSTVSGLISRTVLNTKFILKNDYHGGKFYKELSDSDVSNLFLDTISKHFTPSLMWEAYVEAEKRVPGAIDFRGWKKVEEISKEYGIGSVNLVKPGVGETTRVLLRRVPWKILVQDVDDPDIQHIIMLAKERNVPIETRKDIGYKAIGLIHPKYSKGATGFDGKHDSV